MYSTKLAADFFILAIVMIWPAVHSDVCDEDGFLTIQHTHMPGATKYPAEVDPEACKTKCLQENGCKAIDWNFARITCWLHFKYDEQLKTHETVTHFYHCNNGSLPSFTKDPLAAGFPAINRSNVYNRELAEMLASTTHPNSFPIIILQPPLRSEAAFSEATVETVESYIRSDSNELSYEFLVGIARPNKDEFDLVPVTFVDTAGKFETHPSQDIVTQPGDAFFIISYGRSVTSEGIAYDAGTPDACGVTSMGLVDVKMNIWPNNLKSLDECWMMSIFFNLSPLN